jgi:DNA-binding SARP family transcriptional activator
MRRNPRIALNAIAVLIVVAALGVLWQLRLGLPALPKSWTAPMSNIEAEELLFWLLWIALVLLLLLLARSLLSEITSTIRQRREDKLIAFAERTKPAAPRRAIPQPSLAPVHMDRYAMTLEPRMHPPNGQRREPSAPREDEAQSDAQRGRGEESDPPRPSISVLGPLRINGKRPIKRAATNEMLAFLALHPAGATRDELLEALWPGEDPQRTLPRLYQSVSDARRALGDALTRDRERYRLDRTKIHIDLDELDQLLATTGDARHEREALETALSLWRGQPLAASDYPWAEGAVHQLHATLLEILGRIGTARLQAGDPRGALQAAERAISLDNLHEPSWRLALQADHALGLYSGITKHYDALAHILDEQLGLEPSHETRMMYRELLGQA